MSIFAESIFITAAVVFADNLFFHNNQKTSLYRF